MNYYDSFFDRYISESYFKTDIKKLSNSTWKEYFITCNITNLVKIVPYYVNNDKELDLFILDKEDNLYFVDNIRGTSKSFTHQKVSDKILNDFTVTNRIYKNLENFYIFAVDKKGDKIYKINKNPNYVDINSNNSKSNKIHSNAILEKVNYWETSLFIDFNLNNKNFNKNDIKHLNDNKITNIDIKNDIEKQLNGNKVLSINLYEISEYEQILLLNLENKDIKKNTRLVQLKIKMGDIISYKIIEIDEKELTIFGLFDLNNDGLIDILYFDTNKHLNVLLNMDPYYYKIRICNLNSILIGSKTKLFLADIDNDGYPDIVTSDIDENTIGYFENPGKNYWNDILKFFESNPLKTYRTMYTEKLWLFTSLINFVEDKKLSDFTLLKVIDNPLFSYEIVAVYEDKIYWFIHKDNFNKNNTVMRYLISNNTKINSNSTKSISKYPKKNKFKNSMIKINFNLIQGLTQFNKTRNYNLILNTNLNNDKNPEFIVYSSDDDSLSYFIRIDNIEPSYGWSQNFWIYLIIFIYSFSTLFGLIEIVNLRGVNSKYFSSKNDNMLENEIVHSFDNQIIEMQNKN